MSDFRVKFRGVRGSYPVVERDFLEYGGNTACTEINVGGHLIIIDAGTGLVNVGNELMKNYLTSGMTKEERTPIKAVVLLSHIHQDHIQGFTFFRPLHLPSTVLDVYGNVNYSESLSDELATLLFGKSFPVDLGSIAGNLNIREINETDAIILKKGQTPIVKRIESEKDLTAEKDDVVITCYRSYAHPQEGVLIFKISYKGKSLVYASDKETYFGGDRKLERFAQGCDLLIHDSQYTTEDYMDAFVPKQGYGHSTFEMALECKKKTKAKKLVFFHFDPSYSDEKLNQIKEKFSLIDENAMLAQEGLELEL